jgi:hypothetical protein
MSLKDCAAAKDVEPRNRAKANTRPSVHPQHRRVPPLCVGARKHHVGTVGPVKRANLV